MISPGSEASNKAPMTPPIIPGTANRPTRLRSILPTRKCARPEVPVVNVSAACTQALAVAGATPSSTGLSSMSRHTPCAVDDLRSKANRNEVKNVFPHPSIVPRGSTLEIVITAVSAPLLPLVWPR